ncbi:phenol hydroxylase subunit [Sessilibacter corallicola]|uniref:phenol hydroxylase subunit n=1 Tax=Sessilibacter corallicola TaxID=2904075 RepID=UPI001E53415F|nr:phenol hydroxylase subunit [Sessilibacter corallicola]MCE2030092.1 phenol hydroxylase subunit [Sessilibacter corallicola]
MSRPMTQAFPTTNSDELTQPFDKLIKYVRVRSDPDAKFVEFDFAIGDPNLYVELIMPRVVFDFFCEKNSVTFMTEEQAEAVDEAMKKWRYGEQTLMSKNYENKNL